MHTVQHLQCPLQCCSSILFLPPATQTWRLQLYILSILLRNVGVKTVMKGLQGAPVQGQSATMVITDIQSSAKLTNSMPSAMMADSDRHERLLRHLMLLYNGIEVATEGDSFHVRTTHHMHGHRTFDCAYNMFNTSLCYANIYLLLSSHAVFKRHAALM